MVAPPIVVWPGSVTHVVGGWSPLPPSSACTGVKGAGASVGATVVGDAVGDAVHGRLVHTGYEL